MGICSLRSFSDDEPAVDAHRPTGEVGRAVDAGAGAHEEHVLCGEVLGAEVDQLPPLARHGVGAGGEVDLAVGDHLVLLLGHHGLEHHRVGVPEQGPGDLPHQLHLEAVDHRGTRVALAEVRGVLVDAGNEVTTLVDRVQRAVGGDGAGHGERVPSAA